jgi:hypothetical protein
MNINQALLKAYNVFKVNDNLVNNTYTEHNDDGYLLYYIKNPNADVLPTHYVYYIRDKNIKKTIYCCFPNHQYNICLMNIIL